MLYLKTAITYDSINRMQDVTEVRPVFLATLLYVHTAFLMSNQPPTSQRFYIQHRNDTHSHSWAESEDDDISDQTKEHTYIRMFLQL